ncbi:glycoside hydrolase family 43 protein [Paenibacillus glycanilyticus]|uniref:glycoside hydrolase family 43 protein n=1 Tax=Paenibacillus glycanilyticus TaxID=126569 RepID=UPI00203C5481|nr:glycoside hydrolase family 43 protein [Paenibacillus glycanilyticus]MCM3630553.1 glycoside hydrolase family 43 protein [Paenibacillus glycanilyticus]
MSLDYKAYLFVHFTGEHEDGEQVYFSVSRDGLHWNDLNEGKPVLQSGIGEKGVRDPFVIRSPLDNKFYIIATDLRIASDKGWDAAQHRGSRSIIVWESFDLVHWSKERSAEIALPYAGCVWAPESIFDEEAGEHLMFWASMVKEGDNEPKQIIYSSRTKDFTAFTKPEKYIERGNHVIDTTIIREGDAYYRYSKDETTKCITVESSGSLSPSTFSELHSPVLDNLFGVEGPEVFKFNDRNEWCLMVDQYATGKGYLPLITEDLSSGQFRILNPEEYNLGATKKRHGSFLNLTETEYNALTEAWGTTGR